MTGLELFIFPGLLLKERKMRARERKGRTEERKERKSLSFMYTLLEIFTMYFY
jgi:hypothetical protein